MTEDRFSDYHNREKVKRGQERRNRIVNFSDSMRVILVPSLVDYKSAGLITKLWWSGSDYRFFQQSACSEIRLLSVFEGIDLNAARKKLYGLGSTSLSYFLPESEESSRSSSSSSSKKNDSSIVCPQPSPSNSSPHKPAHTSSEAKDSPEEPSLKPSIENENKEEMVGKFETPSRLSTSVTSPTVEEGDSFLTLCVPLGEAMPLRYIERPSRKAGGEWIKDFITVGVASIFAFVLYQYNFA
jgi:hypothetical protein